MKRVLLTFLAVSFTLPAQKIDSQIPARDRVVRVQTALNHLTVIEVAEPVTTVAVGSPQAFKVERRENKVFIQPLQESVATNLFIWTATTRLNYELVPAISDAGQMDFAIDYQRPKREAELQPALLPPKPESALPTDMLLHSTPVKLVGFPRSKQPHVDITIRDVYRTENQLFIRLRNRESIKVSLPAFNSAYRLAEVAPVRPLAHNACELTIGRRIPAAPALRWHGGNGNCPR